MKNLAQRILVLLISALFFFTGWHLGQIKPELQHKDCVTVLINMRQNSLVDVINESFVPITYEIQPGMAGEYRNWVITITETNHNRMPGPAAEPDAQERARWSNYFSWMDYTNAPNKTNE